MGLSCYCDDDYPEPGNWAYYPPVDFSILNTSRRKRCTSCNELIDIGSECGVIRRCRVPAHDVEIAIYGEDGEISIPNHYMCEECTGLYFALDDLDYCPSLYENQHELAIEHAEIQKNLAKKVQCNNCGWRGKNYEVDDNSYKCPSCEKPYYTSIVDDPFTAGISFDDFSDLALVEQIT